MQLNKFESELQGLRLVFEYLYDGNQEALNALIHIKGNYKQWPEVLKWFKDNKIKGQALADFFKNESDDTGGGYLMGMTVVLSRLDGKKNLLRSVTVKDLR